MRLTKQVVARLGLPDGKTEIIHFDSKLPGFGVRILTSGRKSWIVQYRNGAKQRRVSLGNVDVLDADQARDRAQTMLAEVRLGGDPQKDRRLSRARATQTLGLVSERYLAFRESRMRPRSFAETARHLRQHWKPLHEVALHEITRADIAAELSEIARKSGKVAADRARSSLSALFAWAIREGLTEVNPVINTQKHAGHVERERVLSDAELMEIWQACSDSDYGRIVRLLMLTAARREEVGGMAWQEIDEAKAVWLLPANRSKNHRAHSIPLSDPALECLKAAPRIEGRELVFGRGAGGYSGWSRSKASLDNRIAVARKQAGRELPANAAKGAAGAGWTLHDLRRTAATRMAELGVQPHVIEAILNHVSGHKAGVAGVYNRASYETEKRVALALWAEHIASLVAGRHANVVEFKARR